MSGSLLSSLLRNPHGWGPTGPSLDPYYGPGLVEPGNIDINARPVVRNADGSISTVRSMSIGADGKEYLIPTISQNGNALTDEGAVALFRQTGQHLGAFDTPEHATDYANKLHRQQEDYYSPQPRPGDETWRGLMAPLRTVKGELGQGAGVGLASETESKDPDISISRLLRKGVY